MTAMRLVAQHVAETGAMQSVGFSRNASRISAITGCVRTIPSLLVFQEQFAAMEDRLCALIAPRAIMTAGMVPTKTTRC